MPKPSSSEQELGPWIGLGLDSSITTHIPFPTPTPVQSAVIPLLTRNSDVAVESRTGSGKTLAFVLPVLYKLTRVNKSQNTTFALICSPTRELANQIGEVVKFYTDKIRTMSISSIVLTGGHKDQKKKKNITKSSHLDTHIIIGTPGRLKEMLKNDELNFSKIEYVILDEVDRLLDFGATDELRYILSKCPKQRRTGLFSATLNRDDALKQVGAICGLRNCKVIRLAYSSPTKETTESSKVNHYYSIVPNALDKVKIIYQLLKKICLSKILIFVMTCHEVDYYYDLFSNLKLLNIETFKMHGKMTQKSREDNLRKFENKSDESPTPSILISTDVSARGIDFDDLDLVIQFDPPQKIDFFTHRIGRTGRGDLSLKKSRQYHTLSLFDNWEYFELISKHVLKEKNIEFIGDNVLYKHFNIDIDNTDDFDKDILNFRQNFIYVDRSYFLRAKKAFVSHVRAYSEHEAKHLLPLSELDIGGIANAMCLPRLPRVKEILGKEIHGFQTDYSVKVDDIPFLNRDMETKRLKEKLLREEEEISRKIEKEKKRKEVEIESQQRRTRSQKRQTRRKIDFEDIEECVDEERLFKKFKKGKINYSDFLRKAYGRYHDIDEDISHFDDGDA